MSNLEKRSVPDETQCAELAWHVLPCESSGIHCGEMHAVTLHAPISITGRLPTLADAAGMFLLCVYPLTDREGAKLQNTKGAEQGGSAVAEAEPACYFEERKFPRLTPTETEVMDRLAQGKTNRTIAEEMFISINTVKTHVRSIFQKLGVNSRASAVRLAAAAGLFDHWSPPPSP